MKFLIYALILCLIFVPFSLGRSYEQRDWKEPEELSTTKPPATSELNARKRMPFQYGPPPPAPPAPLPPTPAPTPSCTEICLQQSIDCSSRVIGFSGSSCTAFASDIPGQCLSAPSTCEPTNNYNLCAAGGAGITTISGCFSEECKRPGACPADALVVDYNTTESVCFVNYEPGSCSGGQVCHPPFGLCGTAPTSAPTSAPTDVGQTPAPTTPSPTTPAPTTPSPTTPAPTAPAPTPSPTTPAPTPLSCDDLCSAINVPCQLAVSGLNGTRCQAFTTSTTAICLSSPSNCSSTFEFQYCANRGIPLVDISQCGDVECIRPAACSLGANAADFNDLEELCFIAGEPGACSSGRVCSSTGHCIFPPTPVPSRSPTAAPTPAPTNAPTAAPTTPAPTPSCDALCASSSISCENSVAGWQGNECKLFTSSIAGVCLSPPSSCEATTNYALCSGSSPEVTLSACASVQCIRSSDRCLLGQSSSMNDAPSKVCKINGEPCGTNAICVGPIGRCEQQATLAATTPSTTATVSAQQSTSASTAPETNSQTRASIYPSSTVASMVDSESVASATIASSIASPFVSSEQSSLSSSSRGSSSSSSSSAASSQESSLSFPSLVSSSAGSSSSVRSLSSSSSSSSASSLTNQISSSQLNSPSPLEEQVIVIVNTSITTYIDVNDFPSGNIEIIIQVPPQGYTVPRIEIDNIEERNESISINFFFAGRTFLSDMDGILEVEVARLHSLDHPREFLVAETDRLLSVTISDYAEEDPCLSSESELRKLPLEAGWYALWLVLRELCLDGGETMDEAATPAPGSMEIGLLVIFSLTALIFLILCGLLWICYARLKRAMLSSSTALVTPSYQQSPRSRSHSRSRLGAGVRSRSLSRTTSSQHRRHSALMGQGRGGSKRASRKVYAPPGAVLFEEGRGGEGNYEDMSLQPYDYGDIQLRERYEDLQLQSPIDDEKKGKTKYGETQLGQGREEASEAGTAYLVRERRNENTSPLVGGTGEIYSAPIDPLKKIYATEDVLRRASEKSIEIQYDRVPTELK